MDPDRAHQLLAAERERIEREIAELGADPDSDRDDPGDRGSEDLYQAEYDAGRAADLRDQLAAVERAEARLADGTFGLSVESGEPIPDGRLEAVPTAERTVAEEERIGRG
jgi:RNA polymerase-binding transcription factor